MRRFIPRDFGDRRLTGWVFIAFGLLVLGVGAAGVVLLVSGIFPTMNLRATGFPVFGVVAGLGLVGVGWTNLREARTREREASLRQAQDLRLRRSKKGCAGGGGSAVE